MLTEYVSVHVFGVESHMRGQPRAQPGGIQHGAGADDLGFRQVGGLQNRIGDDIHRVADHHIHRIRREPGDLRHDRFNDIYIRLRQVNARLAGFAGHTDSDDDNVGIDRVFVSAGMDIDRRAERGSLENVGRLAFGFFIVDVDEYDFRRHAVYCQGVGDGGTHVARTENGDFFAFAHMQVPFV